MFMFYKMYTLYQVPGTLLCTGTIVPGYYLVQVPGLYCCLNAQLKTVWPVQN